MVVETIVLEFLRTVGEHAAAEALLVKGEAAYTFTRAAVGSAIYRHAPRISSRYDLGHKLSGPAHQLKEALGKRSRPRTPKRVEVDGVFMPGLLLQFGWWERKNRELNDLRWHGAPSIQKWLYNGFDQWAPSWDINDWSPDQATANDRPFIGQIGTHDESESIGVIVEPGAMANHVREVLNEVSHRHGALVSQARVSGLLCPAEYLAREVTPALRPVIEKMNAHNATPEYCIVVQNDDKHQKVELSPNRAIEMYSGYIWKCISPDLAVKAGERSLSDCFFVWEHTDLSDRDCIAYNLNSLDGKIEYITKLLKSSGTAQHSMELLQRLTPENRLRAGSFPDRPLLQTADFLDLFADGSGH